MRREGGRAIGRTGPAAAALAALALVLAAATGAARAADDGSAPLLDARVDVGDRASLQRGAKLFVNYCVGCHSAKYMRYGRMGRDLGLTGEQLRSNLMLAADKPTDPIVGAVGEADAREWFGIAPPDLSLTSRARGADWLYTYLMTFYRDESRPFGANNLVFPGVAMPHALVELQGVQVLKPAAGGEGHGAPAGPGDRLELAEPGSMSVAGYRRAARDLVNFMVYLGEPAKLERYTVGWWVLAFLLAFFLVAWLLYKEYWRDVY